MIAAPAKSVSTIKNAIEIGIGLSLKALSAIGR